MNTTKLGALRVSRLGLGCMVLTGGYRPADAAEAEATLHLAIGMGITLLDTADAYGDGQNEEFVGRLLGSARDRVVLSSKFGLVPAGDGTIGVNGRPDYVKPACEASLRRLQVEHLDLYYLHRVDPAVPVEETVGAMGQLVTEGKVRHLGLCEVSAAQLRAAHSVHPITAVQSEWSLWARQIEAETVPAARAMGVGLVPYAPLGRGFLAGAVRHPRALAHGDLRAADPRLDGDNLPRNLDLLDALDKMAAGRGVTAAQLALAWLLAQGGDVVPIPGVERRELLRENVGALDLELTAGELALLAATFPPGAAAGTPDATLMRQ